MLPNIQEAWTTKKAKQGFLSASTKIKNPSVCYNPNIAIFTYWQSSPSRTGKG